MADAMAGGTALERVPETEVLVGEIDSTMSYLMLSARQAENLKPLTEEEADGMAPEPEVFHGRNSQAHS